MKDLYDVVDHVLAASRAEGTERNLLQTLAFHMNVETFETRPGHQRLMRWAGVSKSTVQRCLRRLEEKLGEVALISAGNGSHAATYRVLAGADTWSPIRDHVTTWSSGQGGCHPGGVIGSPKVTTQQERKNNYPLHSPSSNGNGEQLEAVAPDLFDTILRRLALDVGNPFIAHTMVEPLEQRGRRGDVLEVLAPDHCELELQRRYGRRLSAIASEVLDTHVEVEIVTERQLRAGGRR